MRGSKPNVKVVLMLSLPLSVEAKGPKPDPQTLGREILSLHIAQGSSWGSVMWQCAVLRPDEGMALMGLSWVGQGGHELLVP